MSPYQRSNPIKEAPQQTISNDQVQALKGEMRKIMKAEFGSIKERLDKFEERSQGRQSQSDLIPRKRGCFQSSLQWNIRDGDSSCWNGSNERSSLWGQPQRIPNLQRMESFPARQIKIANEESYWNNLNERRRNTTKSRRPLEPRRNHKFDTPPSECGSSCWEDWNFTSKPISVSRLKDENKLVPEIKSKVVEMRADFWAKIELTLANVTKNYVQSEQIEWKNSEEKQIEKREERADLVSLERKDLEREKQKNIKSELSENLRENSEKKQEKKANDFAKENEEKRALVVRPTLLMPLCKEDLVLDNKANISLFSFDVSYLQKFGCPFLEELPKKFGGSLLKKLSHDDCPSRGIKLQLQTEICFTPKGMGSLLNNVNWIDKKFHFSTCVRSFDMFEDVALCFGNMLNLQSVFVLKHALNVHFKIVPFQSKFHILRGHELRDIVASLHFGFVALKECQFLVNFFILMKHPLNANFLKNASCIESNASLENSHEVIQVWKDCAKFPYDDCFAHIECLFRETRVCVPICESLAKDTHEGELVGQFGMLKILSVLHEIDFRFQCLWFAECIKHFMMFLHRECVMFSQAKYGQNRFHEFDSFVQRKCFPTLFIPCYNSCLNTNKLVYFNGMITVSFVKKFVWYCAEICANIKKMNENQAWQLNIRSHSGFVVVFEYEIAINCHSSILLNKVFLLELSVFNYKHGTKFEEGFLQLFGFELVVFDPGVYDCVHLQIVWDFIKGKLKFQSSGVDPFQGNTFNLKLLYLFSNIFDQYCACVHVYFLQICDDQILVILMNPKQDNSGFIRIVFDPGIYVTL